MFSWYQRADVCFVLLSDFTRAGDDSLEMRYELSRCRWFTRGWTLQELIAPRDVRFFDAQVNYIGTKTSLADAVASITGIPVGYLTESSQLCDASVAQRMSWASKRSTTRPEDIAYCLLGLFDVNIPLLYGEGSKAFQRLQRAIISQSDDESIFVWLSNKAGDERGMLADSPSEFAATGRIRPIHFEHKRPPAIFTSRGLEMHHAYAHPFTSVWDKFSDSVFGGPLFPADETITLRLDCEYTDRKGIEYWIGIDLRRDLTTGNWYRRDASGLLYAQQNGYFKRLYPAIVGYKRIYIDTPRRGHNSASSSHTSALQAGSFSKYDRSVWMALIWQFAEILSGSSWVWLICVLHDELGLPEPNKLLTWAYLTIIWHLQGQNSGTLVTLLVLGLFGWEADQNTHAFRNMYTAILGFAPVFFLQLVFDTARWKNMPLNSLDTE